MQRNPNAAPMATDRQTRRYAHLYLRDGNQRRMPAEIQAAKRRQRRTLRRALADGSWDVRVSNATDPWDFF